MTEQDNNEQIPSLARREAEARIAKLQSETTALSRQLTPGYERRELLKILAGLGGLLAAFAAIGTFLFSTWRARQDLSDARQVRIEERFDRALESLGRESAGSRLGGVVSLKSFLTAEDRERHSRVLLSLSHALAIESDPIVRDAIVEVFNAIDISVITRPELDEVLNSLVGLNRAFYREGKLNRASITAVKTDSLEARAQSSGAAIVALLKKGARTRNLSGIYCARCDFSRMDLRSTNFDDAVLRLANFEAAILDKASFNRADLENANFQAAHLKNANLRISDEPWYQQQWTYASDDKTLYSWDALEKGEVWVNFPNFRCADLRGADFTGRVLGAFFDSRWSFTGFTRADLEGTKLKDCEVIVVTADQTRVKGMGYHATAGFKEDGKTNWIYRVDLNSAKSEADAASEILDALAVTFEGSSWQHASLPDGLAGLLKNYAPSFPWAGSCASKSK